jgi:predicted Zn finger-like uncharacterized protein
MLRLPRESRNLGMIVACSACNTRFRVADAKVGPRGARIKCTRCGHTFAVGPPVPEPLPEPTPGPVSYEPPPPEPTHVPPEPTGTEGWPTGVLDIAGGAGSDPVSSIGLALETDPFAAFATRSAAHSPPPDPPPPRQDPSGVEDLFGSLPVTDLADLERAAGAPGQPDPVPGFDEAVADGPSLEDRTPSATPVREVAAARWGDPEASQAIEVGPDGFQEVDLARGEARPDPAFDSTAGETTDWQPIAPRASPIEASREAPQPARPEAEGAPGPPASAPPPESTSAARIPPARIAPARARALAMNVLSLAALLVVTLGIVMWWRGEGVGAVLRWPRAGHGGVGVGSVTSGVYEGAHGQPLVFVRGVVRASQEPVEGPVVVRVFLERGGALLGTAMATAGTIAGAEDLAEVRSPEDMRALQARLDSRAPLRLEPGGALPFLALLPLPEGDVGTLRFRVEPVPARER